MSVPPDFKRAGGLALCLIALCLAPTSCSNKSTATASPEADRSGGAASEDPLDRLAELEQEMRARGLPVGPHSRPVGSNVDVSLEVGRDSSHLGGADMTDTDGDAPAPPTPDVVETTTTAPAAVADCEGEVEDDRPNEFWDPADEVNRCASVCGLSDAICDLEVQICTMAEDHDSDLVYADACERAVDDCEVAGDACDRC